MPLRAQHCHVRRRHPGQLEGMHRDPRSSRNAHRQAHLSTPYAPLERLLVGTAPFCHVGPGDRLTKGCRSRPRLAWYSMQSTSCCGSLSHSFHPYRKILRDHRTNLRGLGLRSTHFDGVVASIAFPSLLPSEADSAHSLVMPCNALHPSRVVRDSLKVV